MLFNTDTKEDTKILLICAYIIYVMLSHFEHNRSEVEGIKEYFNTSQHIDIRWFMP